MKSNRRRSREYALQGIYQWLLSGDSADAISKQLSEHKDFSRGDVSYFRDLLYGVIRDSAVLRNTMQPKLDRATSELSPIEHAVLLMATYEFMQHPEIPYRVVINEAIELAKSYASVEGHKYVNGVLDKLAAELRPTEVPTKVNPISTHEL